MQGIDSFDRRASFSYGEELVGASQSALPGTGEERNLGFHPIWAGGTCQPDAFEATVIGTTGSKFVLKYSQTGKWQQSSPDIDQKAFFSAFLTKNDHFSIADTNRHSTPFFGD